MSANSMRSSIPLSRARLVFLEFSICGAYTVWGLLFSIQPPIYPKEAEARGIKPSQYGFVFGCAHLAAFLTAPFFAEYGSRIGPKLLYTCGSLIESVAGGLAFGFLAYANNTTVFLGLSYALRFLFGMANAASFGAVLGILVQLFPERVATIMASCESFFGIGYTIGPAISSFLYQVGGFQVPFWVVGATGIVFGVCLIFALPKMKHETKEDTTTTTKESLTLSTNKKIISTFKVIKSPSIWIGYLDNIVLQCGFGFTESMLEPHAREAAGMAQTQVGYAFLFMGAVYMIGSPIVGRFCDKAKTAAGLSAYSVAGNSSMVVGMLLLGPASFLQFLSPSITLIFLGTFFHGVAYSFNMVSTFARANRAAMELGYEDDINTYLVISGLWTTSYYLGSFVGPTVAGWLVQEVGFRATTSGLVVFYCAAIIGDLGDIVYKTMKGRNGNRRENSEKSELLAKSPSSIGVSN